MSTQVIETNLDLMRADLMEFINDECLDMLDEWQGDEIAEKVIEIGKALTHNEVYDGKLIKFGRPNTDYLIKVNNQLKGFVSVSDNCTTGVSRTLFYPYWVEHGDCFAGLCSLAEMINEAWYQCKN